VLSAISLAQKIWLAVVTCSGNGGSLALFGWLLSLHPTAAGRVYGAYEGVYICVALIWLWKIDRIPMTRWDLLGGAISIAGMSIIVWGGWRGA
jgi:small multidrug resistance family-3 protein